MADPRQNSHLEIHDVQPVAATTVLAPSKSVIKNSSNSTGEVAFVGTHSHMNTLPLDTCTEPNSKSKS